MLRKQVVRVLVGLFIALLVLAHASGRLPLPVIDAAERQLYDLRLRLTMPATPDPRIVIVDIDEKSLAKIGRWPWRRDRMAQLVSLLFTRYQARVVGFDIVMAEADESAGLAAMETLARTTFEGDAGFRQALDKLRPQLDVDAAFATALAGRPVVLGFYLSNEGTSSGALPAPALDAAAMAGHRVPLFSWMNHGGNLARFQAAAAGAGHFNPVVDADGSVRRVPLLVRHGDAYYEAFSLAMVRAYLGQSRLQPHFAGPDADDALDAFLVQGAGRPSLTIPVDDRLAAWVPYRGPVGSFAYVSAADILDQSVAPERLRDKIIIVGTSAPGLRDLRTTPVGEIYPGMEVHANLIGGMLDQRISARPDYSDAVDVLQLLLLAGLMLFAVRWQRPFIATLTTVGLLAALAGANLAFWTGAHLIFPLASALLLGALLYVWNMTYGYFMETRAKVRIARRFGQYVPPELVSRMVEDPARYSMQGRRAELTVLFSDVRGFTGIAEQLEPEALAQLMNQYLTAMTRIIQRHGGTLDKYIGDAIVAFWGAPVADADHARHAVLAALEMQAEMPALNQQLRAQGWPEMQIGVGINTGPMTVGDMGSSIRLAYTVLGDAVNLGARLESKTKEYGVGILVGEATRAAAAGIDFQELDLVQVKGKQAAVRIYLPLREAANASAATASQDTGNDAAKGGDNAPAEGADKDAWQLLLEQYRAGAWAQAEATCARLLARTPSSTLYRLYAQRIAAQRAAPDPTWTGVTRFDSK